MPYSAMPIAKVAAQGRDIRFVCRECGASVVAPVDQVLRRFGQAAALGQVQALAVCGQCHSIDVVLVPTGDTPAR